MQNKESYFSCYNGGNDFPDFIGTDGFIEHFQITSARETRKGSLYIKEQAEWDRTFSEKATAQEEKNQDFSIETIKMLTVQSVQRITSRNCQDAEIDKAILPIEIKIDLNLKLYMIYQQVVGTA